jgi:hypothetical protein
MLRTLRAPPDLRGWGVGGRTRRGFLRHWSAAANPFHVNLVRKVTARRTVRSFWVHGSARLRPANPFDVERSIGQGAENAYGEEKATGEDAGTGAG